MIHVPRVSRLRRIDATSHKQATRTVTKRHESPSFEFSRADLSLSMSIPTSQSDPTNLKKNGEKAAACEADLAKNLLENLALSGEFSEVSLNTLDTLVKETLKPSVRAAC